MIDLESTVLPWIGKSIKTIDCFFMDRFTQNGIELTKVQWLLLKKLKEKNGIAQHNLAFLTNRDKASLARLLTTMEKKNLVARIPSDSDHRINEIYITTYGDKLFKQARPVVIEMINEMQQGLSESDRKVAIHVLKKIMKNINNKDLVAIETK